MFLFSLKKYLSGFRIYTFSPFRHFAKQNFRWKSNKNKALRAFFIQIMERNIHDGLISKQTKKPKNGWKANTIDNRQSTHVTENNQIIYCGKIETNNMCRERCERRQLSQRVCSRMNSREICIKISETVFLSTH